MNKNFLLIFFFGFHFLFSQNESPIFIEGVVIDKNSSETLPLANIVIKNINGKIIAGVTANTFGEFKISLNTNEQNAIIHVSYVGYNNYEKTLELVSNQKLTIKMTTEELNVVDITFFNRVVESPATPPPGLSHMSAIKMGFLYLFESFLASVRDECAE